MDLPREIGQRVGVLGGTFDPVHNGHLAVAEAARRQLELDSLVLIPAAQPPHKSRLHLTPFHHRLAMLRLAVKDRPGLLVSSLEAERPGPSYSVDTLSALREYLGDHVSLFFLVGIDAFVEISTWKCYRQLPLLADIVVVDRPGAESHRLADAVHRAFPGYLADSGQDLWRGPDGLGGIRTLAMAPVDVSSTDVRLLAAAGRSITHLLPPAVAHYIGKHHLYTQLPSC